MSNPKETPAIYVAFWPCSKYMKNSVHAVWIEVVGKSPQEIEREIEDLMVLEVPIVMSKVTKAVQNVQWAIHDCRGFEGIEVVEEECLNRLVEMLEGITKHGEAYAQYVQETGDTWIEAFLAQQVKCA
jgi:antirestriction protein